MLYSAENNEYPWEICESKIIYISSLLALKVVWSSKDSKSKE
jgi:hypothetical protein